jgi:hypothetical protein
MSIAEASTNRANQPSPQSRVIWNALKLIAFLATVIIATLALLGVVGWIALAMIGF